MRGTYTLLLACKKPFKIRMGKLGLIKVERGNYLYTGSALGTGSVSLEQRVARHRRRNKRMKWHVDYLTVPREVVVVNVICTESSKRLECQINRQLLHKLNAKPIARRAGASDCQCSGHLLSVRLLDSKVIMRRVRQIYAMYGKPFFL